MNTIENNGPLLLWIEECGYSDWNFTVVSADASFRSYYRLTSNNDSLIVMDSSLDLDSLVPFININERLSLAKVSVPNIIEKNINLGYLILEDFGSVHYLDILQKENYQRLYRDAIDEIIKMQQADTSNMPIYDKAFLHFEMDLMREWYLDKYLKHVLTDKENQILSNSLKIIADVVLEQPQDVFVHRDFHSRNIMLTNKNRVGIIDFQDARVGAITYDLASLLKDCYIEWDKKEIEKLALYYRDSSKIDVDDETFIRWFDFMGLQRHIKVLGIFSRLHLRDGKDEYLNDIPLTLKYVVETASRYPELKGLTELLLI